LIEICAFSRRIPMEEKLLHVTVDDITTYFDRLAETLECVPAQLDFNVREMGCQE
jgi:hypothetical protein